MAVAAGGAIGALARYLLVGGFDLWLGAGFPLGTLAANPVGSFMIGILIEETALVWSPAPELRALLVLGVLGSVTTVSISSLDVLVLFEHGAAGQAAVYVLASVTLSLAGIYAGKRPLRPALT